MKAAEPFDSVRSPLLALRVRNTADDRLGLVVGKAERWGRRVALVPVIVEASTRSELWPETLLEVLPLEQQHKGLGGTYEAPPGYPLNV